MYYSLHKLKPQKIYLLYSNIPNNDPIMRSKYISVTISKRKGFPKVSTYFSMQNLAANQLRSPFYLCKRVSLAKTKSVFVNHQKPTQAGFNGLMHFADGMAMGLRLGPLLQSPWHL